MGKYLIVNADDFGLCKSANDAVIDLFLDGKLLSSTIMFPAPGHEQAARFAAEHPEYAIGVHLTLTSEWPTYRWKPLTDGKSLVDKDGYMWLKTEDVEKNATYEDLEKEIRAQIDYALSFGFTPSHIDNHMGTLYGNRTGRFGLLKMILRILGELGYSYRLYTKVDKSMVPRGTPYPVYKISSLFTSHWAKKFKVILPDYLLFPDWTRELREGTYEQYRDLILKLWTNIPDGVTETFVHPAFATDEMKSITGSWRDRQWEYDLLKDPDTHKYLKDHGVTMINYRDLIQMKKGR
ncbi:MAG: ChbG/HpnK family deacetylase [Clostridiales bacterium]|nr:ChbG/HpnK family deacetylase [Clostridiales bacterium]